jgi:hypothetical protein
LFYEPRTAPETPAEADRMLATAVLMETVADLQGANPRRRTEAQAAVRDGSLGFWTEVLALTPEQRARAEALLASTGLIVAITESYTSASPPRPRPATPRPSSIG